MLSDFLPLVNDSPAKLRKNSEKIQEKTQREHRKNYDTDLGTLNLF